VGEKRYRAVARPMMMDQIYGDDHLMIRRLDVLGCMRVPKLIQGELGVSACYWVAGGGLRAVDSCSR
jgi:hypothetical protein